MERFYNTACYAVLKGPRHVAHSFSVIGLYGQIRLVTGCETYNLFFLYQLVLNSVQGQGSSQGTNEQFMDPAVLRFQSTAPCSTLLAGNDKKNNRF